MKIVTSFLILLVKTYKYCISPYISSSCRYMPTCSEYFIESLNYYGLFKGLIIGSKRILRCHPIKILGGKSGFDPIPRSKNKIK